MRNICVCTFMGNYFAFTHTTRTMTEILLRSIYGTLHRVFTIYGMAVPFIDICMLHSYK